MHLKGISRWVVGCGVLALLLGFATFAEAFPTFDLARAPGGPGYDTIAPPPPPPPPDIRGVPGPPPEVRPGSQMDEIRRIAPPEDLQKGAGETPGAQGEQAGVAAKAVAAPELAVVTVGVSNSTPRVGERVFVTATLKNTGSRSLSGVKVRFFLGQVQVGEKVVTVPAGGSATASISFAAAQAGAQNLRVQADPGAGIAPLTLARGFTVTGTSKTDVEDFTTPAKKGAVTAATGAAGGQAPLSPQQIPFDKPLLAKKGTELARQPGGAGSPSSPPGSGPPGFKDLTQGLGEPQGVPDTTLGGGSVVGKADLRDGIMGKDDQGDMPKKDYGKDIPDPRQGPGHKTAGHGWGKDPYGQPVFKTPGGKDEKDDLGREDKYGPFSKGVGGPGFWFGYASTHMKRYIWEGIVSQGGTPRFNVGGGGNPEEGWWREDVTNDDGSTETTTWAKDGSATKIRKQGTIVTTTKYDKQGNVTESTTDDTSSWWHDEDKIFGFFGAGGYPRPEGGDAKPTSRSEITLLLLRVERALPSGEEHRGDPLVSDPVLAKGGKAASGPEGGAAPVKGVDLAAAGAAKAEVAWRFAGKKPGSEVTDPAEWQDRKIRDLSMARMKHFEVIDPVDAPGLQSALSQAQAGAASGGRAPSITITSVAGGVQRLTTQEGKQGWAPLKAGDTLSAGSAIRISQEGGQVGVTNLNTALSVRWTLVQQTAKGKVYQLQGPK